MMFRGYSGCQTVVTKNISRNGPQNCRSLGFARDDKKERVVVKERAVAEGKGGC
jgi:hypothetical protein